MPTHYYKANKTINGQQNLKKRKKTKKKKRCRNGHTPAGEEEKETKK